MSKRGADLFYNSLVKHNIKHVFGYLGGGGVMPLFDTLYKNPDIKYYINSNEQNVGHAATGYAKTSNKIGVALVSNGAGITNIITPMLDATTDSTPLVVISGQDYKSKSKSKSINAIALSKNATKWSYQVENANDIMDVMTEAFNVANNRKKGAVHIDIPKCVSTGIVDKDVYLDALDTNDTTYLPTQYKFNTKYLKKAIRKINASKSPIIILGHGCVNTSELATDFIKKTNIPTTSTIRGCGILDEHHPLSMRWCGIHGSAAANYAIQEADCIIALGSSFDDRTTGLIEKYAPNAIKNKAIIHVNIEQSEIGKVINSNYNFNMDCGVFLKNAIRYVKYRPHVRKEWIDRVNSLKSKYDFKFPIKSKHILNMEYVLDSIYRTTLGRDVIFTTGVGNHQMQAYQFIKSDYPNKIISSSSLGVMGVGLPYAIGAQIANPNKLVVVIDGDSSFNMTLSDLKTIREHNLDIKIAIMNNDAQMNVSIWGKLLYNERYATTIREHNPDFCKLAESYGIPSIYCNDYTTLDKQVETFLNHQGPILCEFKIERDIYLPLVGPNKPPDDMTFPEHYNNNDKSRLRDV